MALNLQLPAKLEPLLTKRKRFKIAYGGRGGGKSQAFAGAFVMGTQVYGWKVGCFREYHNSMADSVHSLLADEITRLGAPGFRVSDKKIDNVSGGKFRFRGLARNPDGVKSMHGFDRFWVEEAQGLSSGSLKILTPTMREGEGEQWFSLNPMSSADPMSQRFLVPFQDYLDRDGYYEDDLHLIVKINYTDNPWFPAGLEAERQFDYANLPRNLYDHIWLGEYNDQVEGSIILPEWFDAAVDAHKWLGFKPRGIKVCAYDPSDEGKDDKSIVIRHGSVITRAETLATGDSNEGTDWALDQAIKERVDLFNWDCDGLGASLKRQVRQALEGKGIDWSMYKGSESPDRAEEYYEGSRADGKGQRRKIKEVVKNKRAQYYMDLRDRFQKTWLAVAKGEYIDPDELISISSDIPEIGKLRSEICRIPQKHNGNGLFQVMTKKEMATSRFKIPSPNLADSAKMSLCVERGKKGKHLPLTPNARPFVGDSAAGY